MWRQCRIVVMYSGPMLFRPLRESCYLQRRATGARDSHNLCAAEAHGEVATLSKRLKYRGSGI